MRRKLKTLAHRTLYHASARFRSIAAHPIFVVGCGHSGTTIITRLLGGHARIHEFGRETNIFLEGCSYFLTDFDLEAYWRGAHRWVEKTPGHVRHIPEILAARPQAKLIFMVRDARDVALSLRKRLGELQFGIDRWISDNRLGAQWRDHPQVMSVRYEDFVLDPPATISAILQFLDEDFTDEIFGRATSDEPPRPESQAGAHHLSYREWQVAQPIFDGSGKWRKELSAEDVALVESQAADLMREFGYTLNGSD